MKYLEIDAAHGQIQADFTAVMEQPMGEKMVIDRSTKKRTLLFFFLLKITYPLVMTNIAMEAMAHRNRWFTELKNADFP